MNENNKAPPFGGSGHHVTDTIDIVCPHCGHKRDPTFCGMHDGDENGLECGVCGKEFRVYCTVLRTFSTEKFP